VTGILRDELQRALGPAYRLERELGGGGMSHVFVAHEEALGRDVVVKVLAPELAQGLSVERFAREIRLAAALQEPHIVPVLAAGVTADGLPYYTMPYVRGESLRARMAAGPVPLGEAVAILRDVATALEHAHARGIVHRDIKPDNVLLSGRTAVVTDFGIAKALAASRTQERRGDGTLTQLGTSLGTPAYMAPEQAAGDDVDARADVYAWGVVAYELLAGRHPFAGRATAQQLMAAHIAEAPPALAHAAPHVPRHLAALVTACLAKTPAERPADADALLTGLDTSAARAPTGFRIAGLRARALVAAALAVVAVVVAVGSAVLVARARRPAAAATLHVPAVTVLPFENLSGDSSSAYLSDGMTEELVGVLERARVLRVASRATTFSYKGRREDPRRVAEATGADAVLTGSVRRSGDRLRVVAELARGSDGARLWGETYERSMSDVFAVQDEIARAIATSLSVRLARADGGTAAPRVDPAAYDDYLRARHLLAGRYEPHGGRGAVERAVALLERAVARDSAFARGWARLGRAYVAMADYVPAREVLPRAKQAVERAVQLDPTNAEVALARAGILLNYDWDWEGAEREYLRALALDPHSVQAHQQYAFFLAQLRRGEAARRELAQASMLQARQATDTGGLRAMLLADSAGLLAMTGDTAGARQGFAEALRLASGNPEVNWMAARWLGPLGEADAGVRAIEVARRARGDRFPMRTHLAVAYAWAGHPDTARRVLAELERRARTAYVPKDQIAALRLALGDRAGALRALRQGVDERHYWMPFNNNSTYFRPLRTDPEFRRLMKRLNVPDYAR
jgi:TolB-like protein/tRNA A-37 threonylcarbamoyl transferase component Bud32/Tfp pilus assembly protein PilF